jgi:hypothetical protein
VLVKKLLLNVGKNSFKRGKKYFHPLKEIVYMMLELQDCFLFCFSETFMSSIALQIGFSVVLFPSVLLAYIGQAAYLRIYPENVANTFYKSIPGKNL